MSDKPKDPRKVYVGPNSESPEEEALPVNVVSLPTEYIDFRSEQTDTFDVATFEPSTGDKVKEFGRRCQTALRKKKVDGGKEVDRESGGEGRREKSVFERQTYSAHTLRQRTIQEKCDTIQKVAVTCAVVAVCIAVVIFVIWFQFALYNWSHAQ